MNAPKRDRRTRANSKSGRNEGSWMKGVEGFRGRKNWGFREEKNELVSDHLAKLDIKREGKENQKG